jgi:hypothetical protein
MKGNIFAYVVLILWPVFAIYLYRTKTIQVAILWTILGGFMFLPVRTLIDFPLVPPLGKDSMPVLAAFLGLWLVKGKKISFSLNHRWIKWLLYLYVISPIITVILNNDTVNMGIRILPALSYHDAISITINNILIILPLFMGSQYFRSYESQLLMFKTLVVAGLGYSVLMLYEIRMSPQLHSSIYGYFPHSFAQQKRFGGFRPVVFMGHGLWVAFFAMAILLAATTMSKNGIKAWKFSSTKVSYYFFMVLILCKSMGSVIYGLFGFLLIKYTSNKLQMRVAIVVTVLALAYPTMSILKWVPYDQITNAAAVIDDDRAGSLKFRFDNEVLLLNHARERFFFGWGGWGRNRVFDSESGEDVAITDGRWIITFGQYGWFGFIAEFGLLGMAIFRANKALKLVKDKNQKNMLTAHALLVCLIMLDQIPNATLAPWMWLIAGILLGRSESIIAEYRNESKLTTNLGIDNVR